MVEKGTGLVTADNRPITARDIAQIRVKANLQPGPGGGFNAYPYDAAQPYSPDAAGWVPWIRSADAESNFDHERLVARARDLVRNDAWADGAINRLLDACVGAHFLPIPQPNTEALQRRYGPQFDETWAEEFGEAIRSEWKMWAEGPDFRCDAARTQTFSQMCRTALRAKVVEGDALAMNLWQPKNVLLGSSDYATCVQLIDGDRLSNPQEMVDTHDRRRGVQIDDFGAPVGYHIRRAHPYDWYEPVRSIIWDFFPREDRYGRRLVVHDFDKLRAGQHRGIGILTSALLRFKQLHQYDDASLKAALIRATMGFFVTSPRDADDVGDDLDIQSGAAAQQYFKGLADALYNQHPVAINGNRIPILAQGDKIQTVSGNGQTDDYGIIQDSGHRSIAAATGQATPEISNDFSKLNYSSFRGAMLQAQKTMLRRRKDFAVGFATQPYACFVEEVVERFPELLPRGVSPAEFPDMRAALVGVMWIGPGRGWVDPVKERQGEVLGLDAGFGTLQDSCAEIEGEYWQDRLNQRAREVRRMTALGLKLPNWAAEIPASTADRKPLAE